MSNVFVFQNPKNHGIKPYEHSQVEEKQIDEESIKILEESLERYKKGELYGCILISSITTDEEMNYESRMAQTVGQNPMGYIGFLEVVKHSIAGVSYSEDYHDE